MARQKLSACFVQLAASQAKLELYTKLPGQDLLSVMPGLEMILSVLEDMLFGRCSVLWTDGVALSVSTSRCIDLTEIDIYFKHSLNMFV